MTPLCKVILRAHRTDSKILLGCCYRVQKLCKIRFSDGFNQPGRPTYPLPCHTGGEINVVRVTPLCKGILRAHRTDSKILLGCCHRVPSGWKIRISDRSNQPGCPTYLLTWHTGGEINVARDTPLCKGILRAHRTDSKNLLGCCHRVPWGWKIRISDRSDLIRGRSSGCSGAR